MGKMRKIALTLILIAALMISFFNVREVSAKRNFSGTWVAVKNDSFGRKAKVIIKKKIVIVYWVTDTSKSLYWYGSWNPKKKGKKYIVKSKNNHSKTDRSMYASGDDYKKFSCNKNTITFSSSMLGVTDKIIVKKK